MIVFQIIFEGAMRMVIFCRNEYFVSDKQKALAGEVLCIWLSQETPSHKWFAAQKIFLVSRQKPNAEHKICDNGGSIS